MSGSRAGVRRRGPPAPPAVAADAAAMVPAVRRPAARAAATKTRAAAADGWDPLQIFVAGMLLTSLWRVQEIWPVLGTLQLPTLSFLGAGGLLLLDSDPRRGLRRLPHPVTWLVAALTVLLVATVPGSVYAEGSYNFLQRDHVKTLLLATIAAASVRSFADLRRLAGVQVFGGALYAAFALRASSGMAGDRLSDLLYYDANDFGMLMVCTVPLAAYFLAAGRSARARLGAALAIGLFTLGMVRSGSRAAFVGFGVLAVYLLLGFRAVSAGRRVAAVLGAAAAIALAGGDAFWAQMRSLLQPMQDYNWVGNAPDGRMEIWKRGIGYMLDRPFLGVGVGVFPVADGLLAPQAERQRYGLGWRWAAAHNAFVQIGAEAGVTGLLLFLALLGVALRTSFRIGFGSRGPPDTSAHAAMGQALTGVLIAYCANGFFLSQAYGVLLYSTLALVVALASTCTPRPRRR
ncbi:MAG TPA: O-antigen ligase family protein [Longimicrobiales bacterium]